MLTAFIGLVFILLASLIPDARGQCRKLRFTIGSRHGQRLENHVIRTIDAISEDNCQVECLLESNCVSYNFKTEANTGGKHKCDLNNATYEHDNEHSGDLAKKENYVYRGAENVCAKKPCQNNSTCQAGFTDRDYQCLCVAGFTGHDCEVDVNECTKGTHNCDVNAVCNNTQGSYHCTCKDGFYGDGITCKDIDECTNRTHSCDVNAVCNNTEGSYNCTCKDGFHGDGINCTDIDDCANGCHYKKLLVAVSNIDECTNGTHSCDVNAVCNNTRGSYNCTCKDGFHGNGINCTDVNECTKGTHSCDVNAVCNNTQGSYNCRCKDGFYGDGKTCRDLNECTKGTHNCDVNAVCNNTQGSYNCMCKDGFYGDGKTCKDIDECTHGTHICDVNAVCNNTRGSYNCTCKDGFHGDGINCTDIDECTKGKHRCDVNAVCNNTRGSYNCTCKNGFHGNGIYCTDVNECTKGTHSCDVNAVCNNTQGSYNCRCKDGFYGDGKTCRAGLNYSTIVGNNQTFLTWLGKWLKSVTRQSSYWNRCYQATVNGWSSSTFHSNCDDKGPSLIIIRVGNYIFGGFTNLTWRSDKRSVCQHRYDSKAFLFSLVNKLGLKPLKLNQVGTDSIYCCYSHGPIFGSGPDVQIATNAGSNKNSYSDLGYTYSPPPGNSHGSSFTRSFLAGSYHFQPDEVEVFYETS